MNPVGLDLQTAYELFEDKVGRCLMALICEIETIYWYRDVYVLHWRDIEDPNLPPNAVKSKDLFQRKVTIYVCQGEN